MRKKYLLFLLCATGIFLTNCSYGYNQPQIVTVEVTRLVENTRTALTEVKYITPEPQVVPVEVTRIVQETRIVIVEATRLVTDTPIVTVEVTPITPTNVVITPSPFVKLTADVTPGVSMLVNRANHTATRLLDGKILLIGGSRAPDEHIAEVEIFDPETGLTTLVAQLHTPRHDHSATLLPDGRVLVVGGYNLPQQWLVDAEIYDPYSDVWTVVLPLYAHGVKHSATLMEDGRVLVVGGCIGSGICTERVEIFDPQTDIWTEAMSLEGNRASHTSLLLDDGRVLAVGGEASDGSPIGGDALLYNPNLNTWSSTGEMVNPRFFAQSIRLPDGRILIVGGINQEDAVNEGSNWKMSAKTEIYNPASNIWAAADDLSQARYGHVLVPIQDGLVLVSGGTRDWACCWTNDSFVREIEIYDPVADRWHIAGEIPEQGFGSAAIPMPDGRVWVTGGQTNTSFSSNTWFMAVEQAQP